MFEFAYFNQIITKSMDLDSWIRDNGLGGYVNVLKEETEEVIEAYKEARELTDEYLYEDHTKWLKTAFNNGWFEFPDDYDFLSSRWTLGLMLAQTERYGGIVMDTKKGTLPVSLDTPIPDGREYRITEDEE